MDKRIVKKIVLFVSPLLFAISLGGIYTRQTSDESFLKEAWGGWEAPCLDADDGCGGFCVGLNTCAGSVPYCDGSCPSLVPQGAPNEYCAHILPWSCKENPNAFCSTIVTYKCFTGMYDPPHCLCEEWGLGGDFGRTDC